MKKVLSLLLAAVLLVGGMLALTSCSASDYEAISKKGYFVCGITVYEPMSYFDGDGNLTGFDTDFANAVAKKMGLEAKFQVINWGSKYAELESGAIDCIWNGFTVGNESDGTPRTDYVDFSKAYLENAQCVVTKADAKVTALTALAGKKGTAEGGSSGEAFAQEASDSYIPSESQQKALMEVKAGTADFAVIDLQMAKAMVGTGDFTTLALCEAIVLPSEVYAIGFRKGSDFTDKVNAVIDQLYKDGTMAAIAEKYDLENDLVVSD